MCTEETCPWFLFLHRNDTHGHYAVRMLCRKVSRIGLEKLPGEAEQPEASWFSTRDAQHEEVK